MPTVKILLYPVNAWLLDMSLLSKSHTEYLLLYYDNGGQNVIMDLSVSILIWSLILKTLIVDSELIFSIQLQYTPVEYFIIYGNITDISIYNNYKVFYNI